MLVIRLRPGSGVADLALLSGSPPSRVCLALLCHPCPYDAKEGEGYTRIVKFHVDLLLILIPQGEPRA